MNVRFSGFISQKRILVVFLIQSSSFFVAYFLSFFLFGRVASIHFILFVLVSFLLASLFHQEKSRIWLNVILSVAISLSLFLCRTYPYIVYLYLFIGSILLFGLPKPGRVPLFLSAKKSFEQLMKSLPLQQEHVFIDLGSGTGRVLSCLASQKNRWMLHGIESAWIPYVISRILLYRHNSVRIEKSDFMQIDLGRFSVIYAFLSPEHMQQIWQKIREECKRGTIFISLSFPVTGCGYFRKVDIGEDTFFIYRVCKTI